MKIILIIITFGIILPLRKSVLADREWKTPTQSGNTKAASSQSKNQRIDANNSSLSRDNQSKRDLSLSYSATDIGSKEGTHVKTITVIKNFFDNNNNNNAAVKKLKINPELHKSEEWGSKIRDNFDTFGKLPDIPDVDELFEFVNQKRPKEKEKKPITEKPSEEKKPNSVKPNGTESFKPEDMKKVDVDEGTKETVTETLVEKESPNGGGGVDVGPVEKIEGDAELVPNAGKQKQLKSQSLSSGKYRVREAIIDDSESNQTQQKYHNNYIQSNSYHYQAKENEKENFNIGYSPSPRPQQGSVSILTTSGRNYDVPVSNETVAQKPYLAPAVAKKNQFNPILVKNPGNFGPTQPPQFPQRRLQPTPYPTSSQRPYVAPNLRKTCDVSTNTGNNGNSSPIPTNIISNYNGNQSPPPSLSTLPPGYSYVQTKVKTFNFGASGDYKPYNSPRFRGLRIQ